MLLNWFASSALLILLSYTTQDFRPKDGNTQNCLGPPTLSVVTKMPYSCISWRNFPKGDSFLCDNSSLCQVNIKQASIQCLCFWTQIFHASLFKCVLSPNHSGLILKKILSALYEFFKDQKPSNLLS